MSNDDYSGRIDAEAYQAALYAIGKKYPRIDRAVVGEIIEIYLQQFNKIKARRNAPVGTVDGSGCDL